MIFDQYDLDEDGFVIVPTGDLLIAQEQIKAAEKRALDLEIELYTLRSWQSAAPVPRPIRAFGIGARGR